MRLANFHDLCCTDLVPFTQLELVGRCFNDSFIALNQFIKVKESYTHMAAFSRINLI